VSPIPKRFLKYAVPATSPDLGAPAGGIPERFLKYVPPDTTAQAPPQGASPTAPPPLPPTGFAAQHPGWTSAIGMIPAVTSGIAGLIGGGEGPVSIGAAGLGGSSGEIIRELLSQQLGLHNAGTGVDWTKVGQQGAVGAGSQAAGGLLTKGLGLAARPIMRGALLPAGKAGAKMLERMPSVVEEAMQAGTIPGLPGKFGKSMVRRLGGMIGESGTRLNDLLTRYEAAGARHSLADITAPVEEEIATLQKSRLPADQRAAADLQSHLDDFTRLNTAGGALKPDLRPLDVNAIKTGSQGVADRLYAGRAAQKAVGGAVPEATSEERFHELLASGAKKELEQLSLPGAPRYPGVLRPGEMDIAARNLKTQGLMGAQQALKSGRGGGMGRLAMRYGAPAVLGGGLGGALGGRRGAIEGAAAAEALSTPAITGILAHGLNNPAVQALLAQLPRIGTAGLVQP